MLYAAIALLGLLMATYTDLRDRTIPNTLTYGMVFLGLTGHLIETVFAASLEPIMFSIAGAIIAFVFAYLLWKIGAWAGGDVKLFAGIGALLPLPYVGVPAFYNSLPLFPFIILMNSVMIAFPFIMMYVFAKTVTDKKLHKHASHMLASITSRTLLVALGIFGAYSIVSWAQLPSWLSILFVGGLAFAPHKHLVALAASIIGLGLTMDASALIPIAISSIAFISFLEAAGYGIKHVLRKRIPISQSEGEISAETLYVEKGKVKKYEASPLKMLLSGFSVPKRTLVSEYNAAGIELEDIKALEKKGIKTVLIKQSMPMVPILLLGLAASVFVGDLVWLVVKLL